MNIATGAFSILETREGGVVRLAMESLWLTGRVLPVGARLVVVHTFRSAEAQPLEVVYAFGLPRDAALRRFKVVGEGFQVRSALKPVEEARKAYERGIDEGQLAALATTYRDGRVNLTVGNLRPGETVKVFLELVAGVDLRDDGLRFRFPFTLAPCYHAQARTAAPEAGVGEMELPAAEFEDLILPQWMTDASPLHRVGFDLSVAMPEAITELGSPSHGVRVSGTGTREARVELARAGDVPDRDLVLDVRTAGREARVFGGLRRGGRGHFTVVVPSPCFGKTAVGTRHVMFLLDRSGSMSGAPLDQARKALAACLAALRGTDQFGVVAFDDTCETVADQLLPASVQNRERARSFLDGIAARGGTELGLGIERAVSVLGGVGDVFVLTDGQVSATEAILASAKNHGVRLHSLGIGAASQDRFLTLLARETGGVSRFVTPDERVDLEALELFASSSQALADQLEARFPGSPAIRVVGEVPSRVFPGQPLVLMAETGGARSGRLEVRWQTPDTPGLWSMDVALEPSSDAELVWLLHGARLITDLEALWEGKAERHEAGRRKQERFRRKLEALGRTYGLANRALSLVAVVERPGDDPTQLPKTRVVPVGLPHAVAFDAYFPRATSPAAARATCLMCFSSEPAPGQLMAYRQLMGAGLVEGSVRSRGQGVGKAEAFYAAEAAAAADAQDREDVLIDLASRLEADGGFPGKDLDERAARSLLLLLCFLADGHALTVGPFRQHVRRLTEFLESTGPGLSDAAHQRLVADVVERVRRGPSLPELAFDWAHRMLTDPTLSGGMPWTELASKLGSAA